MSRAKYFYFVTSHLCFLGKPSVWGSRPWSGPTPSPFSSSPSPAPPPPAPGFLLVCYSHTRLPGDLIPGWDGRVCDGPPGGLMIASTASPLFLQEPRERKLLFISSHLFPIWASSLFCQSEIRFLSNSSAFLLREKKEALRLIPQQKITPITSDPTILELIEVQWCHHFTAWGTRFTPIIWGHNCFGFFLGLFWVTWHFHDLRITNRCSWK